MSDKIQRFSFVLDAYSARMKPDPEGDYIKFKDIVKAKCQPLRCRTLHNVVVENRKLREELRLRTEELEAALKELE